ncbi:MMPL family transporter [Kitasatospora sp. NPDC056783]|uniref:MMPL family transporter n=1 Tax=Kitasatospora sp. NPDC056783 TaxID=3345943 RepID=UPI0036A2939C
MPTPVERTARHAPPTPGRKPLIERVAGWSAENRKTALIGWIVCVVLALAVGSMTGGGSPKAYDPGESGHAQRMIDQAGPNSRPPAESVLIQAGPDAPVFAANPAMRKAATEVADALRALPADTLTELREPTGDAGKNQVSPDGRSVLVGFSLAGPGYGWDNADANVALTQAAVAKVAAAHPDLKIVEAGNASVNQAVSKATAKDFARAEQTSVPLTLLVLLVVFGALVAAGIPVLLSITAVAAALGLMHLVGHWVPVNNSAASVVLLVGMAVGVDYSLFYLRRVREERLAGRPHADALRVTAATSGRAVAVSGLTVMVSMAGLLFTGIDTFTGMTLGTIIVVLLAVVGSLTALPALLSMLGHRMDAGRLPWLGRRRAAARDSRMWRALVGQVVRRPLVWGGSVLALMLVAALPALDMRLADPSLQDELPRSVPEIANMVAIQDAFPGSPAPAIVVARGPVVHGGEFDRAITALHRQVADSNGALHEPVAVVPVGEPANNTVVVYVPLAGNTSDAPAVAALKTLREKALPESLGTVNGLEYAVTGETAISDFADAVRGSTPWVFTFVLGFAFLLLVAAFRSLAVPLVSIALNLVSIGAAYGVITWIFQEGHGSSLVGFHPYGGVISWLPLFMFVILFGLSMDYHVFILSRIRELHVRGDDGRTAVTKGISGSAGVVTSAAAVMVAVFSIFATLSMADYKMLGVGMAVAVLIDATLVRGVLLPAALALLGERSWVLPGWLAWVPSLSVEGEVEGEVEGWTGSGTGSEVAPAAGGTEHGVPAPQAPVREPVREPVRA